MRGVEPVKRPIGGLGCEHRLITSISCAVGSIKKMSSRVFGRRRHCCLAAERT